MNKGKKSRKLLLIATALTIIALVTVLGVYAAVLIGTITGGTVTVGGPSGSVTYDYTNNAGGTWLTTINPGTGTPWYARLEITSGYKGSVTVTFQLEQNTGSGYSPISGDSVTTPALTLTGSSQYVYASATDGTTNSTNTNWGTYTSSGGAYEIVATVNSSP